MGTVPHELNNIHNDMPKLEYSFHSKSTQTLLQRQNVASHHNDDRIGEHERINGGPHVLTCARHSPRARADTHCQATMRSSHRLCQSFLHRYVGEVGDVLNWGQHRLCQIVNQQTRRLHTVLVSSDERAYSKLTLTLHRTVCEISPSTVSGRQFNSIDEETRTVVFSGPEIGDSVNLDAQVRPALRWGPNSNILPDSQLPQPHSQSPSLPGPQQCLPTFIFIF